MQTNTFEATATKGRFTVVAEAELMKHIEQHRQRVQQQTGVRLSLSQAATGLLRRGLEVAQ
ncbi:hypothetical protein C8K18_12518 [Paraburkholderia sp. GV068]|jgi:hypothetical protein|uniref:hypothetical protein n=1 Tax=Paraburkholderia TaxID=1822464 RepID=UPI000D4AB249|nr:MULTISPECIES: hypothetical protein [Paraburkholderia]MDR6474437.1 hypothetical protein [Paraburkholderia graminis]PTQ91855.1 hypothetical protein C8K19_12518 [Paraburkholderia sp. GV072]PUA94065.1 hypothetical protein C8K18_12518 [Paraburkholderia sp. GV068]